MTAAEKKRFDQMEQRIEGFLGDRYEPKNGWKTARAEFEGKTIEHLKHIDEKLAIMPDLIKQVNFNTQHRILCEEDKKRFKPNLANYLVLFVVAIDIILRFTIN